MTFVDASPQLIGLAVLNLAVLLLWLVGLWRDRVTRRRARTQDVHLESLLREIERRDGERLPPAADSCRSDGVSEAGWPSPSTALRGMGLDLAGRPGGVR